MRLLSGTIATIIAGITAASLVRSIFLYNVRAGAPDFMLPDATKTKSEVLKYIPVGTSILEAKDRMTRSGFKCGSMKHTTYADYANPSNVQVSRGPADILHCDSGEKSSGLLFVSKRWQVMFEDTEGKVSYVSVGVGLTGP